MAHRQAGGKGDGDVPLVPKTWELVRRSPDEEREEVLAAGVLSYDLCPDGSVVYADGSAVYHLGPDKVPTRICRGKLIERVTALAGTPAADGGGGAVVE